MFSMLAEVVSLPASMDAAVWAGVALYAVKSAVDAIAARRSGNLADNMAKRPSMPTATAAAFADLPCSAHAAQLKALAETITVLRESQVRIEEKLDRVIEREIVPKGRTRA